MKKRIVAILSLILALMMLCSCQTEAPPQDVSQEVNGIRINGVSLEEYTLVYEASSLYAEYAAMNLSVLLEQRYGISLFWQPDSSAENTYEILVGDTNRVRGKTDTGSGLDSQQFKVEAEGNKILLVAKGYMVGGAAGYLADLCGSAQITDNYRAVTIDDAPVTKTYQYKEAKNVLFYIGDGLGINHVEWAKKETITSFYAEDMPNIGYVTTHSADNSITDSAAAGTALATGYKTNNGYVGITPDETVLKNIRELAYEKGAKTAILTNDPFTEATPAAFTVHTKNRNNTAEVKAQQNALVAEKKLDILLGSLPDWMLAQSQNTLKTISEGDGTFFMMLEESDTDTYSHTAKRDKDRVLRAVARFNDIIAYAMQFTLVRGDVLFVVTADHENGGVVPNGDSYQFTPGVEHSAADVKVYAMGQGAEYFAGKTIDNVMIPKVLAKVYGEDNFGDPSITE